MGVGMFDNYEYCSWETLGQGQFKPVANADPNIGELGKLEVLEEYKKVYIRFYLDNFNNNWQ